nr:hypothetical protein [Pseudohoeflea sp. DP4N28-3]
MQPAGIIAHLPLFIGLALVFGLGLIDDLRGLGAPTKLLVQLIAAAIAAQGLGLEAGILSVLPPLVALAIATVILTAFINLVNFMDGIDLMSVAGVGTGLFFLALLAALSSAGGSQVLVLGLGLVGALIGFGWHNRPKARIFLGDSGSLPLGLAAGYLALTASEAVHPAIALLPFSYYLVDASLTVAKRLRAGENIFRAHAAHAYQHAHRNGVGTWRLVTEVALIGAATGMAALYGSTLSGPSTFFVAAGAWLAALVFYLRLRAV